MDKKNENQNDGGMATVMVKIEVGLLEIGSRLAWTGENPAKPN